MINISIIDIKVRFLCNYM